jgi:hypothetical protein
VKRCLLPDLGSGLAGSLFLERIEDDRFLSEEKGFNDDIIGGVRERIRAREREIERDRGGVGGSWMGE